MAKLISCECGYVARGDSEAEVVALIEAHMRSDHPDVLGRVSRDDIVGWIQEE